jgi:hypothetical protein
MIDRSPDVFVATPRLELVSRLTEAANRAPIRTTGVSPARRSIRSDLRGLVEAKNGDAQLFNAFTVRA